MVETRARVAELVDALASGASVLRDVEVQVLSRVPDNRHHCEVVFFIARQVLEPRQPVLMTGHVSTSELARQLADIGGLLDAGIENSLWIEQLFDIFE